MVSVLDLFISAFLPVANIFITCLMGFALAKKGILDAHARQVLSQLIFWVFVPSLVFTELGAAVDLNNLAIWWILPFNILLSIVLGLLVGYLFAKLLRVDHWFRGHFMCAVALGNVGNLPIVLIQSICSNSHAPYAQLFPNSRTCEKQGIAYTAFGMWVASAAQYCMAYNLLKKKQSPPSEALSKSPSTSTYLDSPQLGQDVEMHVIQKGGQGAQAVAQDGEWKSADPEQPETSVLIHARPGQDKENLLQPVGSDIVGALGLEAGPEDEEEEEAERLMSGLEAGSSHSGGRARQEVAIWQESGRQWWHWSPGGAQLRRQRREEVFRWVMAIPWGSYLNMPTLAAIAGLSVGCVSALKLLLFGDSPPLQFLTQSLEIMAGGMIPAMMLILGSSLAKGPGSAQLDPRVTLGCLLVKLVVMPAIGTGVVVGMLKLGLFTAPNPLFLLVILLCHAPPTAMNLQTVTTLNKNGEEEMSTLLCWQYLAALITIPLWMLLFVAISSP